MIGLDVTRAWEQVLRQDGSVSLSSLGREKRRQFRAATMAGTLTHGLRWLRRIGLRPLVQVRSRRLRVRETVSLGEKRLVAILEVDGVEYLVGGGSSSVTLLTPLATSKRPLSSFGDALVEAGQQAGVA